MKGTKTEIVAAFVADCHVGNHKQFGVAVTNGLNDRARRIINALRAAVQACETMGAPVLCICGDLFDSSSVTPQLIHATGLALSSKTVEVAIIAGNHDQRTESANDNALAPLSFVRNITVYDSGSETCRGGAENVGIRFIPFKGEDAAAYIPQAMSEEPGVLPHLHVAVAHTGIVDRATPQFLRGARDAIAADTMFAAMKEYEYTHAFVGNWHLEQQWQDGDHTIVQCGPLVPTGFNNPGLDHGSLWFLHSDGSVTRRVIPGPRFLKYVWEDEDFDQLLVGLMKLPHHIYLHVTADPSRMKAAREKLAELRAKHTYFVDFKVTPNVAVAQQAARVAARGARNAASVDEAVERFVSRMALPEHVDRKRVREHVSRFLSKTT